MGRSQVYRGNPELKQYYLVNDFSGGINTSDVDERVTDSEFRELVNVELSERGKIQNRKGFGLMSNLRDWLSTKSVTIASDTDEIVFFTVFRDSERILQKIETYEDYSAFSTAEDLTEYSIIIYYAIRTSTTITFKRLKIVNGGVTTHDMSNGTIVSFTFSGTLKEIPVTGIEYVTHENSLYLSLNQIASDLEGILKIELKLPDNNLSSYVEYSVIDLDSGYMPNPYEVSNVGFNLMSNDPVSYIAIDSSGAAEIRSAYITETSTSTPLDYIPKSGSFVLNIVTKGNVFDLDGVPISSQLQITSYALDLDGTKRDLDTSFSFISQEESSAIIKYNVNIRPESATNVVLKVAKTEVITDTIKRTDTLLTDHIAYYNNDGKRYVVLTGSKYYSVYTPPVGEIYSLSLETYPAYMCSYPGGSVSIPSRESYNLPIVKYVGVTTGGIPIYSFASDTPSYAEYANTTQYAVFFAVTTNSYEYVSVIKFDSNGAPTNEAVFACITTTPIDGLITSVDSQTLTLGDVVYVTDTSKYYSYLGTHLESSALDFVEVDATLYTEDVLSYLMNYDIKDSEFSKPIEPINLKNIKMSVIDNRLVIYGGNTLIFSDENKFDYFPNYNYIVLTLHGGDSIQRIAYFRGSWIIFTKESIYRMSGKFAQEDFLVTMINDSIGCVSPNSVRSINNTLIFLSRDGLYTIKQNFYMDGLENVDKVDKNIRNLYTVGINYDSVLYNEQYWLFVKGDDAKTIKQYYNMEFSRRTYPYVVDKYAVDPDILFKVEGNLYSLKYGQFYKYDEGYTDFAPYLTLEEDLPDYMYKMTITTPNYMLGAPTHDKKFKNIYVKTDSITSIPIYITMYINNLVWSTPYDYYAEVNELGQIEYYEITNKVSLTTSQAAESNLELSDPLDAGVVSSIDTDLVLGAYNLGTSTLGLDRYQVHKVTTSAKGKTLAVKIEQKTNDYFAILDIGILFKLGKVKES